MAWGKRKQEKDKTVAQLTTSSGKQQNLATYASTVGPSMVFKGDVDETQDMLVLGKIIGSIHCKGLVHVGGTGIVDGDIVCDTALIEGCVTGDIRSHNTVKLEAIGKVIGDIYYKNIVTVQGSIIQGKALKIDGNSPKDTAGKSKSSQNDDKKQHEKVGTS